MSKKIKQITDILGQENMPENVRGLLSLLASSASSGGPPAAEASEAKPEHREEAAAPEPSRQEDNSDMACKVRGVMDMLSSNNDARIGLLFALKPFLSAKRQKKLNNCINLLRMSSLTRLMDNEKGDL